MSLRRHRLTVTRCPWGRHNAPVHGVRLPWSPTTKWGMCWGSDLYRDWWKTRPPVGPGWLIGWSGVEDGGWHLQPSAPPYDGICGCSSYYHHGRASCCVPFFLVGGSVSTGHKPKIGTWRSWWHVREFMTRTWSVAVTPPNSTVYMRRPPARKAYAEGTSRSTCDSPTRLFPPRRPP